MSGFICGVNPQEASTVPETILEHQGQKCDSISSMHIRIRACGPIWDGHQQIPDASLVVINTLTHDSYREVPMSQ